MKKRILIFVLVAIFGAALCACDRTASKENIGENTTSEDNTSEDNTSEDNTGEGKFEDIIVTEKYTEDGKLIETHTQPNGEYKEFHYDSNRCLESTIEYLAGGLKIECLYENECLIKMVEYWPNGDKTENYYDENETWIKSIRFFVDGTKVETVLNESGNIFEYFYNEDSILCGKNELTPERKLICEFLYDMETGELWREVKYDNDKLVSVYENQRMSPWTIYDTYENGIRVQREIKYKEVTSDTPASEIITCDAKGNLDIGRVTCPDGSYRINYYKLSDEGSFIYYGEWYNKDGVLVATTTQENYGDEPELNIIIP